MTNYTVTSPLPPDGLQALAEWVLTDDVHFTFPDGTKTISTGEFVNLFRQCEREGLAAIGVYASGKPVAIILCRQCAADAIDFCLLAPQRVWSSPDVWEELQPAIQDGLDRLFCHPGVSRLQTMFPAGNHAARLQLEKFGGETVGVVETPQFAGRLVPMVRGAIERTAWEQLRRRSSCGAPN